MFKVSYNLTVTNASLQGHSVLIQFFRFSPTLCLENGWSESETDQKMGLGGWVMYLVYMGYYWLLNFKVILISFSTFSICPIFTNLISWKRLAVEQKRPKVGALAHVLCVYGYFRLLSVQCQFEVIWYIWGFPIFNNFVSWKRLAIDRKRPKSDNRGWVLIDSVYGTFNC